MPFQKGQLLMRRFKGGWKPASHATEDLPSSCFDNLPIELLHTITSLLDDNELCLFRLSCKRIYESTRRHFACAFFQTLHTDLSLTQLERSRAISADLELAPHVRTLVVRVLPDRVFGEGLSWSRHSFGYLLPEQSVQQWTEILRRLVNCTTFQLIRHGWSDKDEDLDRFTPTDAITMILHTVIEARIPVREFLVDFKHPNSTGANELDVRRINVPDLQMPGFIAAWANLQVLQLNFTMDPTMITDWVDPLVRHASSLRKLTIQFDLGSEAEAIIERLSSIDPPSQLQELTLQSASEISGGRLRDLLYRHRDSLRVLDIKFIRLKDSDWKSIFGALGEFSLLESFNFSFLKEEHYVHFPIASENLVTDGATKFTFRPKRLGGRSINTSVSCWGPSAKVTLQKLAESMELASYLRR
ncbi:uncharacterized protein N7459_002776 [Penicillium hispanicum]|uniref:uncharacterized protein n=1 Tax=Penicillium hispanicum TaxID=1080232 RepID=UPI002540972B|nr:uncharacterized protein N7459_002776 [Penicillium hispanicum]KAJ5587011.1 hypothetical protein N7459_002776 [Penicillium hispanicum]